MKNPQDKCARTTCGKRRGWHLGLGGMGICRPEFLDGSSEMTKSDESTGGFIEPGSLAEALKTLPAFQEADEIMRFERLPEGEHYLWFGQVGDDRKFRIIVKNGDDAKHRSLRVEVETPAGWQPVDRMLDETVVLAEAILYWNSIGLFEPLR